MDWERVVGSGLAISAGALGWFGYRAARRKDRAEGTRAEVALAVDGLAKALAASQSDVRDLRGALHAVDTALDAMTTKYQVSQEDNLKFREEVRACTSRLEAMSAKHDALAAELTRLRLKYGNGAAA